MAEPFAPPAHIVEASIARALAEDIGQGDLTTEATVPAGTWAVARIVARASGVIAGIPIARQIFHALEPEIQFESTIHDGDAVHPGDTIVSLRGPARAILTGERVALNFLQQLSGVATLTRKICDRIEGTGVHLLDTRKTVPGLRALQRYAVRAGGGVNHRFNLYDGILIKENHIAAAGGIRPAIDRARGLVGPMTRIEIEVETLEQLEEVLSVGVDIILLDNMTPDEMRKAVQITDGRALLEASGDITLDTAAVIAETGINFISSGALTHSASALNLSLLMTADDAHSA